MPKLNLTGVHEALLALRNEELEHCAENHDHHLQWAHQAILFLAEHFHLSARSSPQSSGRSSVVLYGHTGGFAARTPTHWRDSGHEEFLGVLIALERGLVFFIPCLRDHDHYGGLLFRDAASHRWVHQATWNTSNVLVIREQANVALIETSTGLGLPGLNTTLHISENRWNELWPWLNYWLPGKVW